ncbi:hypothetical protein JZ751_003331 [Albula glossodonta]|uniref:N-glycosylase/DNA lyase n=1 Tax=Albula glossodonta TaxID=121402 RepID=A0A8T2N6R2_9TELE|nr:hypothetical protein JZ751_003331 [Albula glossodonta]
MQGMLYSRPPEGLKLRESDIRLHYQRRAWRETGEGHWTGVMGGRVWTLTQTDDTLWYHTYSAPGSEGEVNGRKRRVEVRPQGSAKRTKVSVTVKEEEPTEGLELKVINTEQDLKDEEALKDYFQLNVNLADLYKQWGAADHHFKKIAKTFTGTAPSPTTTSHPANFSRYYTFPYHDFPTLQTLADSSVEACLRNLGFGYRARFLQQSARQIVDTHGSDWLDGLRSAPYLEARDALRSLPGVGLKVADCVCLMSLDKASAVPVDTHVWQIAQRDYRCCVGKGQKSLTDKVHKEIGDFFRELWGPYAGWAHSVLFCSDLKKFQKLKEIAVKKEEEVVEVKITSEKVVKRNKKGASGQKVKCETSQ